MCSMNSRICAYQWAQNRYFARTQGLQLEGNREIGHKNYFKILYEAILWVQLEPVLFSLLNRHLPILCKHLFSVTVLQRNNKMYTYTKTFILRNWVIPYVQLWELASRESAEQDDRLENQESQPSGLSLKTVCSGDHETREV